MVTVQVLLDQICTLVLMLFFCYLLLLFLDLGKKDFLVVLFALVEKSVHFN